MLSIHYESVGDRFAMDSATAGGEYEIRRGQTPVAVLKALVGVAPASIIIDGSSYKLWKAGNKFRLRLDGKDVASATRPSFSFRRVFDVVWELKAYKLKQTPIFSNKFAVLEGDRAIGSIFWANVDNSKLDQFIDLPDEIGLEVQIFMTWLLISTGMVGEDEDYGSGWDYD